MQLAVQERLEQIHLQQNAVTHEGQSLKLDFSHLPAHACRYCGFHEETSVVKCNVCSKWFCNGNGVTSASHIVQHLVRSKHKEVVLHAESSLGETLLECYNCGCKNVFLLGFIPAKAESVIVLLCREPCLHSASVKDMNWDISQWMPLLEDKAFLDWVVRRPSAEEQEECRPLQANQIARLEESWKTTPQADMEAFEVVGVEEEIEPVHLQFEDAYAYQNVFAPLVKLEAEYDKLMKEQQSCDNIVIRWELGMNQKRVAYFIFPKADNELRLVPGDELRLKLNLGLRMWECVGHVIKILPNEEVALELKNNLDVPVDISYGYTVEFVWKSVSFDRMHTALRSFVMDDDSMSPTIQKRLLGQIAEQEPIPVALPKKLNVPGLPPLNESQMQAVKTVLCNTFNLIQGPPGTGKTVTSAVIVYHLAKLFKEQVLVTSPSNVAVDQLTEKIHATGLKVVRVCAKSRESVASTVDFLTLHYQARHLEASGPLARLNALKESQGELSAADEKRYHRLKLKAEMSILSHADVICCTCAAAGDPRLSSFTFKRVLVDEITQATEPEALIPLVLGAEHVTLVGDHCQLGPVIMCKKAAHAGLTQSLFERLILVGGRPIRLQVQYRMHPCLSSFPSNTFYDGALQNGVTSSQRVPAAGFPWPKSSHPNLFWSSTGYEELSSSGTSYLNRAEASNVEKAVTALLKAGVRPADLGVITPYEGQRAHLVTTFARSAGVRASIYAEIEVASVDAFQGREKDYIILSCVRSSEQQGLGFLSDPRRLNVALTRAKYGLIVVGNPRVLAKQNLWNNLLQHYKAEDALLDGTIAHWRPSLVSFPRAKPFNFNRYFRTHDVEHLYALHHPRNADNSDGGPVYASVPIPMTSVHAMMSSIGPAVSAVLSSTETGGNAGGSGSGKRRHRDRDSKKPTMSQPLSQSLSQSSDSMSSLGGSFSQQSLSQQSQQSLA